VRVTEVSPYPVWAGSRNFLFVVVGTDEGIWGVGEAGLTGRELAVSGALDHLRPLLLGADPNRTEHLWQVLSRGGFFPAQRVLSAAIAAVDIALWDIKGKRLGVPVCDLLGGPVRDRVACYGHLPDAAVEVGDLVQAAARLRDEGWRYIRWSLPTPDGAFEPGPAVRAAVAQAAALRAAFGDDLELLLDAHTRLDPPDAAWLCRALEPLRPFFVEDPLRAENLGSYQTLRARTAVPLAAGEQLCSKWEFRELIERELVDYLRLDLCIAGGFTEAAKIAAAAETHQLRLAPHNPLGPVATAATLQFSLACPGVVVQEQPTRPGTTLTDVVPVQPRWQDGHLLPHDGPGLGIEFDREAAARHPPRWTEPPHLTRADGSFTNW
jgi:L-alanine-DL-glutamate epimerase-like enolase superfamily enzyme